MAQRKSKKYKIAVLGYGSQGQAIALNCADSGHDVIVGLPTKSKSRKIAKKDSLKVTTPPNAVKSADIIVFALPDHMQGRIFSKEIEPHLSKGQTLLFLHGFSIHFGFIQPPDFVDVIMIAPHAPGIAVREKYLEKESISAFSATQQDYSKNAAKIINNVAQAVGIDKKKLVKTTFKYEAIGDLFGEQAVLCGGMSELILNGYKVLTKNGIPEENAYLEVAYQLDLIISLIKQFGIEGMYERISVAARYGAIKNGKKIIDASVRKKMEAVYKEIDSGQFPEKLNSLNEKDIQNLAKKVKSSSISSFEKNAHKYSKK